MIRLTKIAIFFVTLVIGVNAGNKEELWCYQCNANLSQGRSGECNDPYTAAAPDLVLCPQNETYLCLKSLIFYKNVHVTVRGCVPAREKNSYCSVKEAYPEASLECLFCEDYACNTSPPSATSPTNRLLVVSLIALLLTASFDR